MTDSTLPSLDAIQARADAATEGPWEVTQDKCWGETFPSLSIQRVYEYTDSDPAHAGCEPLDAEDVAFIAAARTDVPVLVAALRAVLALHVPEKPRRDPDFHHTDRVCTECGDPFPCRTYTAVTAHIDTTPKETP